MPDNVIISNMSRIGISLGSNYLDAAQSVNLLKKLEFERIVSSHSAMIHEPQIDDETEERELLHLSSIDHLSLNLVEDRTIVVDAQHNFLLTRNKNISSSRPNKKTKSAKGGKRSKTIK